MINLEKYSGLPITLKDDFTLQFEKGVEGWPLQTREFSAMKNYLQNPSSSFWNKTAYLMYRNLSLPEHKEQIEKANLEYDITVIVPGLMGREFSKTVGHYHPFKTGTSVRVPEVYEVIYGKVYWLIQSATPDLESLSQVFIIEAERGDKIIVPPGYGHVSINPTNDVLVMSNWQPLNNKGIYEPYERKAGGAFYVLQRDRLSPDGKSTSQDIEFAPNLNYSKLPKLILAKPRELPKFALVNSLPVYFSATRDLSVLDFLTSPENYLEDLTPEKLFKW